MGQVSKTALGNMNLAELNEKAMGAISLTIN